MSDRSRGFALAGALMLVYFVAYPGDAEAVVAPLSTFAELSKSFSPWLYLLAATALVAGAIVRTWGPGAKR